MEHRLGLSSVSGLFSVITSFSLCVKGGLSSLVLGNLVGSVLAASLAFAIGSSGLGNVDHLDFVVD